MDPITKYTSVQGKPAGKRFLSTENSWTPLHLPSHCLLQVSARQPESIGQL